MERGPWALFWAIVAVGLGPAMWLGVQFGEATDAPQRPPAVTVRQDDVVQPASGVLGSTGNDPVGGEGAGVGDDPTVDSTQVTEPPRTEPPRDSRPVRTSPSPSATSSSPSAEPSTPETSASVPPSGEPSAEPTESDSHATPGDLLISEN